MIVLCNLTNPPPSLPHALLCSVSRAIAEYLWYLEDYFGTDYMTKLKDRWIWCVMLSCSQHYCSVMKRSHLGLLLHLHL